MNASLFPVSIPKRHGFVARAVAGILPMFLLAGIGAAVFLRGSGATGTSARGFAEAIPLNVAPAVGGRLVELKVAMGQPVKAGEVIGRLDGRAITLERTRAEAERGLLQAKLEAETSRQDDAVTRAEVWRLRTVANADSDVAQLEALDKELERLDGLLASNLVKASDVEPKRRLREKLAARVQSFERARASGQAGWDTKKGGTDGHRAVVEIRTAPLREALNVKQAELAQIDLRLASLELRAPADGVVSAINRRPGEVLTAGEAAVVIVAHRIGVFEVFLPQNHAQAPEVGASVTLGRPGILTQRAQGRVIEVAPTITELPVRLRLSPQVPVWGRRIVIDASKSDVMRAVPPGEEVRVRL